MTTLKYFYTCCNCGKRITDRGIIYICKECAKENTPLKPPKGILKVHYNYDFLKKCFDIKKNIFEEIKEKKFIDILPINSESSLSPLKTGNTPLYSFNAKTILKTAQNFNLYFKDDSRNPTFSLKDRASDIVSAWAKEQNINTIIAASTGNAGSSIAGICASQNQNAIVLVPAKAPFAKLLQIMHYGARIVPVNGTYDDAFELSLKISEKYGFYNRNTAFNPFTIEGKKTAAFEIFDGLNQKLPDIIFVSVGDGVIISGIYKGFDDLLKLGIIRKIPTIVAVQSDKSRNLISNLYSKDFKISKSETIADSISVDVPRNFYMARDYILQHKGIPVIVSDNEILEASLLLSNKTGIFCEPASSAAFAGLLKYTKENKIQELANVVVLITGSGLKDIRNIEPMHAMPTAIKADINSITF